MYQCVLAPPDGQPIWFGRGRYANGARRTAYIDEANIVSSPDHYVQSTERHPMDFLATILTEHCWDRLSTGVELDNYWFTFAAYLALQHHPPNARLKDAAGLVNARRAIKSAQELA